MKNFFLVEDHTLTQKGVKDYIEGAGGKEKWKCAGFAKNAEEAALALEKLKKKRLPEIAVLDISLCGKADGILLLKKIKSDFSEIKCVCYSMHKSPAIVQKALAAGAKGYVSKSADVSELLLCMERVAAGGLYVETGLLLPVVQFESEAASLTKREREVCGLLIEERTNAEIASMMKISKRTVENFVSTIYDKLSCPSREDLLKRFGIEGGGIIVES